MNVRDLVREAVKAELTRQEWQVTEPDDVLGKGLAYSEAAHNIATIDPAALVDAVMTALQARDAALTALVGHLKAEEDELLDYLRDEIEAAPADAKEVPIDIKAARLLVALADAIDP